MKTFEKFLEAYRTFDNRAPHSRFKNAVFDEVSTAKVINNNMGEQGFVLLQSKNYFIIKDKETVILYQLYVIDNNVIYLKNREKLDSSYKRLFQMLLIELLDIPNIKYIEDDDSHTEDSVRSVESLLNGRIEIRVYDKFNKKESVIVNNTKPLWHTDNSIRYYKAHWLPESIIERCLDTYGVVPDGIRYGEDTTKLK